MGGAESDDVDHPFLLSRNMRLGRVVGGVMLTARARSLVDFSVALLNRRKIRYTLLNAAKIAASGIPEKSRAKVRCF